MSELEYTKLIDASEPDSPTAVTLPIEAKTSEVLEMVLGHQEILGRMSAGFDPSEFDVIPRDRVYDTPNMSEGAAGDELDLLAGADEMFQPAPKEQFPIFKQALSDFQAESAPKVVRVDNSQTYGEFACEQAIEELDRRMVALKNALHAHMDDDHAHHVDRVMNALEEHIADPLAHKSRLVRDVRNDEVMGAAQAISDLRHATTPEEAIDAMPTVPVDLPPFAEGKVKCWKDGDYVVCSMRFDDANGRVRVATMAARPRVDETAVEGWAVRSGLDPAHILGILPDIADSACGKRLVRDTARAAMQARLRDDVLGMTNDPVLLVNPGSESSAPLAALMYLQQRADAGDEDAAEEMAKIRIAAQTPSGRAIAAPLLDQADKRLRVGKKQKALAAGSFANRYMLMGCCL